MSLFTQGGLTIDGLIVDHEGTVRVFQGGMSGEDGVVGLDNRGGDLWGRVDRELELGFLAIIDRETLEKESAKARAGATTERVEDEEALETSAAVGNLTDAVEDRVNELLADGIVTTGVVVGSVLLARDQLLFCRFGTTVEE